MHLIRHRQLSVPLAAILLVVWALATPALGADWPQFRGPGRDGRSNETDLLVQWPEGGPKVVWRTELGPGFSGIAVVADRVYTLFAEGAEERVVCLDAASGREIWHAPVGGTFKDSFGNGPRSTPTVDDGRVFAVGAKGRLVALSAADGKQLWAHDLPKEYGTKPPRWGYATSPLIEKHLLLMDVGGDGGSSIVAFDKKSGTEVWRSLTDKAGYSTPITVTVAGQRQSIFFTGTNLVAVSPADGALVWKESWKTSYDVNASTPIFIPPDKVFVSSGYDVGAAVYRIRGSRLEQVWRNREMKNKFSSSVLHDGHIYGFDEKTLKCVDAASGETRWRERGFGHGSLIYANGHLLVLGDEGDLAVVRAASDGYHEQSRAKVFDGKSWTAPALAGGTLYLRDQKELMALDLSR